MRDTASVPLINDFKKRAIKCIWPSMCNLIYISTDSERDLGAIDSILFKLRKPTAEDTVSVEGYFRYPNTWYLESQYGGCSCHFRQLMSGSDFWFGPPEDWYEEDDDDVEATAAVYDVFTDLITSGSRVAVLISWNLETDEFKDVEVRLSEVDRSSFRFWVGCRFDLVA